MKNKGRLFLLDDDELIISMLARALRKEGYETQVQTSGKGIIKKIATWHPDLVFLDINLGEELTGIDILKEVRKEKIDTEVVILTSDDSVETAIAAMKLGAADYLNKPFNVEEVKLVVRDLLEKGRLKEEMKYLRKTNASCFEQDMVAESPSMKAIVEKAEKLAEAKVSTVLITGESGCGKEVLARHIHNWRNLNHGEDAEYVPYITVNCTTLPDNLIESELFGHTKWAFTDAKTDKKGLFELADGGTILLDEIGEMRLDLQAKFLRVLEERMVRRLGGKIDLPIDVTVIATTNRDLQKAVENGDFREDLFFRLSTFALQIPPLRDRGTDILVLARHFLVHFSHKYIKKNIKGFSPEAERALLSYSWPGNVRELRNVIERCVVLENTEMLTPEHLPHEISARPFVERRKNARIILPEKGISLEEVEKDLVKQALERSNYNKTKAAKLLNITYDTLRYQVKKFELDRQTS